jgi:hypothetical protein
MTDRKLEAPSIDPNDDGEDTSRMTPGSSQSQSQSQQEKLDSLDMAVSTSSQRLGLSGRLGVRTGDSSTTTQPAPTSSRGTLFWFRDSEPLTVAGSYTVEVTYTETRGHVLTALVASRVIVVAYLLATVSVVHRLMTRQIYTTAFAVNRQ